MKRTIELVIFACDVASKIICSAIRPLTYISNFIQRRSKQSTS
jgi:hypothetical protein